MPDIRSFFANTTPNGRQQVVGLTPAIRSFFANTTPNGRQPVVVAPKIKTGCDFAKEMSVVKCSRPLFGKEKKECGICYEKNCTVRTGCGHDFCGRCIAKIIGSNKNMTSAPSCSFCREPITKISTSITEMHVKLCTFINNLH
jgi:hypothetical protein